MKLFRVGFANGLNKVLSHLLRASDAERRLADGARLSKADLLFEVSIRDCLSRSGGFLTAD